jgi:serine/threonine protein kinase
VKVADVGDAKVLQTSRNTAVGTPFFVAPEVGRGRYTTKADVFSVGMSMVETVLRCLVDGGGALLLNSLVYMDRRDDMVADAAARVESRCPELCELLRECCAAEPEDRPDAATAMRRVATLCAKQRLRERLGEVIAMEDGSDVRVDAGEVEREGLRLADDVIVALHRKLMVSSVSVFLPYIRRHLPPSCAHMPSIGRVDTSTVAYVMVSCLMSCASR